MQVLLQWFLGWLLPYVKQPYLKEFFAGLAPLVTSIAVEPVAMRRNTVGQIEVFLRQRKPHESFAGFWHCPGSLLRVGEQPAGVLARLKQADLGSIRHYQYVGGEPICCAEPRGWFMLLIYLVELEHASPEGTWWPVNDLPDDLAPHHKLIVIPKAVGAFTLEALPRPYS